ncbi:MAG: alpha/beta fold hydrolase [Candidatus Lernaella stagnicola]|nr:alpha/beta fold hydrolase [Candidatus Lernaella stagnicola]
MKKALLIVLVLLLAGGFAVALADLAPPPDAWGDDIVLELTASDGVKIHGRFTNARRHGARALILVHMLGRTHADWEAFAEAARARGICTVAIDLRGHGASNQDKSGKKLVWKNFSGEDFRNAVKDVDAAYQYLAQIPHIDRDAIAVVGASIGANLALNFAAEHPDTIQAAVLLSPGKNYKGVATEAAAKSYPGKMLFYAAKGDSYSYQSTKQLVALAGDRAVFRDFPGNAHGTRAFDTDKKFIAEILDWLDKNL